MGELKRFQGSTFDTVARRKLVGDRDTILELTGKIQKLQYEINCMNVRENFKMLNQYAVDNPYVTSQPVFFPLHVLWECLAEKTVRQTFGIHMVYRETFLQIQQRLLQHLIRRF